ncbi:MAG TPA: response regulator [Verrucomicrobiae bacterium]
MNRQVNLSQRRVLVVDDDDGARESIRLLLGIDGHHVTEARDGAEALGRFQQGGFDLVITDYRMPNMLGDELALNIRTLVPQQPIVMVTAYFEQLGGRPVAADAVLAKPFGVDELRLAMAKPMARVLPPTASQSASAAELSGGGQQSMRERASHTTRILKDILQQRSTCSRRSGLGD